MEISPMKPIFSLIIIICSSSLLMHTRGTCERNSRAVRKCTDGGPAIEFPFWVRSQQQHPQRGGCDCPGFELVCRENTAIIHFPSYGDLQVKSIDYEHRKLNLIDPKSCVHEVFLNLNLSLSPLSYYYTLKDYTYINCSSPLQNSSSEIPCLSGLGSHVYTVEPSFAVPGSCKEVKTVAIPFSYSPYLSGNSFGLGLTWDSAQCEGCNSKGGLCRDLPIARVFIGVTKTSIIILAWVALIIINIRRSTAQRLQEEKLLGDDAPKNTGSEAV